jgi:O-antigen/teichoic acid export membrane protein
MIHRTSSVKPGPSNGRGLATLWRRGAAIGTFTLTQLLVQALIAVTGLIVLRQLSKPEYALYTLAVSAMSMLNVLTDFGLSHAVIALGGQRFGSTGEVEAIVAASLRVRRILFVAAGAVAALAMPFILAKQGGTPAMIVLIVAVVAAASWLQAGSSIFFGVLRLYGKLARLQIIDVTANGVKLLLLLLFAFGALSLGWCMFALITGTAIHYAFCRYSVRALIGSQRASTAHYRLLWNFCRPLIASTAFNTVAGQITIWMLSILSTTTAIAEIGALGRFVALSTIFGAVMGSIGMPYLSRLRDERLVRSAAFQGGGLLLGGIAGLMVSCWQWPAAWLFILGPKYANMRTELRYQIAAVCILMAGNYCYAVLASRGATGGQWKIIPATLAAVALGALASPPLNTVSAARFQLFVVAPQLLVQGTLLLSYFRNARVSAAPAVEDAIATI